MSSLKDRIRAQRQAHADKAAGMERHYKFAAGKTIFRIVPGKDDPSDFFQKIGIHWIKNKQGGVITAVGDRELCFGEPCPVRAQIEQLKQQATEAGDDDLVKLAKDMLAKERYFANIKILKAPGEFPTVPTIAEFPSLAWESIMSQMEAQLEEIDGDADPLKEGPLALVGGLTFVIEKSGAGLNTKYNVYLHPKKSDVTAAEYAGITELGAFKRSWFDKRTNEALAALSAMTGVNMGAIADRLAAPQGKALPPPNSTPGKPAAKAAALAGDDWDDIDVGGGADDDVGEVLDDAEILDELNNL